MCHNTGFLGHQAKPVKETEDEFQEIADYSHSSEPNTVKEATITESNEEFVKAVEVYKKGTTCHY